MVSERRLRRVRVAQRILGPRRPFFFILFYLLKRCLPLILVGTAVFFAWRLEVFSVKDVSIFFEAREFEPDRIKDFVTEWAQGKNLLLLRSGDLVSILPREFLTVVAVSVEKRWPNRLIVRVKQREPLARLGLDREDEESSPSAFFYASAVQSSELIIDRTGLIFWKDQLADLPWLGLKGAAEDFVLGNQLKGTREILLIQILRLTREVGLDVLLVRPVGQDILLVLGDQTTVWLSPDKDLAVAIEALRAVLEKYRIEAKKVLKIDLRFRNPVVEFR